MDLNRFDLDLERLHRSKAIAVARMARSLKERGQLTPVIVMESRECFLLVDGFKRYRAAEKLGRTFLNAVAVQADLKKAKAMVYLLNRSGGFSIIQEALFVKELIEIDGLTRSEAGLLMDRHKSWVSRRLDMVRRLSRELVEALLLELIPPGVGPSLARVPPCNQADFAAAIQVHRLAPNEIRRLADLYCKAKEPGMQQVILQSPRQVLSVVQQELQGAKRPERVILRIQSMLDGLRMQIPAERREVFTEHRRQLELILKDILKLIEKEATCD